MSEKNHGSDAVQDEHALICLKCRSTNIIADETSTWSVSIDHESKEVCFTNEAADGVDNMRCGDCEAPFKLPKEVEDYQWNFN